DGIGAGVNRLGELLLAGPQRGLGRLPGSDIAEGSDDAEASLDPDEAAGDHAGQGFAVTGEELRFDVVQRLVARELLIKNFTLLFVLPEADLRGIAVDDLAGLPAEGLGEARSEEHTSELQSRE